MLVRVRVSTATHNTSLETMLFANSGNSQAISDILDLSVAIVSQIELSCETAVIISVWVSSLFGKVGKQLRAVA